MNSKIEYGEYVILGNLKKGDRFVWGGRIGVIRAPQKSSKITFFPCVTWESDKSGMPPAPINTDVVRRVL